MRSPRRIKPFLKWIESEWLKNPDLRFGQLLINLGLVDNSIGTWRYELSDYPIPLDVARGILTWGTYGKNGKGKYKEVYLKDLDTDHIKQILKTQKHIEDMPIRYYLKLELNSRRKNGKKKSN
jgi:hypothetical protein